MAVITISRDLACGGRKIGRILATRLGYQYVDKSLFQKIAEDLNVSEKTLESFEKSREYRISNIFSKLYSKHYIERIVGYDKSVVEEQEYQNSLKRLILEVAQEDNVVIIGRGACFFLKDMENCFRFRLVASMAWRKKHAVKELGISDAQAETILTKSDKNHLWFHRTICGEGFDSPLLFHLTLNMDVIPAEKAVDIMMSVVNLKKQK
ncbi:MAG: cytidylate kinase-like family protein [Pseudomonadota bacterium]|uniref:Cytidylate kinase-like family protein n=1 Tax=Candidatus Desulfatibia profunda TaxID=2841695 RepID=A0A8J6TI08_9BACT|nr:cytidylate kinase-like family protein [Candidatus Desulfatibia profunda]